MTAGSICWRIALLLIAGFGWSCTAVAQELEPRRWTHLPKGLNFVGVGYARAHGDIDFDPVLQIDDADFRLDSAVVSYVRSHGFFGKSARFDILVPYHRGRWSGILEGEPARTDRDGIGDPRLRLSVLLHGGPAENRQEFATSEKSATIVGAGLAVVLPLGEYDEERLINLGQNRWVVRPHLGVTHSRGKWTYELTGSVGFFGKNRDFWMDNTLESDPLYFLQTHLIHTFRPGLWVSLSAGYGWGFESEISGVEKNNETGNLVGALSVGLPIDRKQGVKLAWVRLRTRENTGLDSDGLILAYSVMF